MSFNTHQDSIIVTGATGFIGFHLVQKLVKLGKKVLAVDNNLRGGFKSSEIFFRKNHIKFFYVDLCDQNEINLLNEELTSTSLIYHLAAFNGTNNFYKTPYKVLRNSTLPLLNLIDKCVSLNLKPKIIYTGSSESYAYGVNKGFNNIPTDEEAILALGPLNNPRWSYGCGKLNGEYALYNAYHEYGIPFVIARVHNIYGPRMGLNHFFSDFICRCLNGEFYLYSPYQTRAYHFIDDCLEALLMIVNNSKAELNVFNIGSNEETRNLDCAQKILNELGLKNKLEFKDPPLGSVSRRKPDLKKLFKMFPELMNQTPLNQGIKSTVDWYLQNNIDFDQNED